MKKISFVINLVLVIIFLGGCVSLGNLSDKGDEKASETTEVILDKGNIEIIDLVVGVGKVNIKYGDVKDIKVVYTKKVTGNSKDKVEAELKNFMVDFLADGGTLSVKAYLDDNKNKDIWKYTGFSFNYSLDTEITIPNEYKDIKDTSVSIGVGDVVLDGLQGVIEIESGVGNVTLDNLISESVLKLGVGDLVAKNTVLTGNNTVQIGTGNAKIDLNDIKDANSLKIESGVGDITLTLPNEASYKLRYQGFMEGEVNETKGSGDTDIELIAGVGKVNVK